ncbi:MAG: metal-sensitive transcriptional regulator [Deinococcus sp.]|nr:metal-sensitive transcriptional regulator [Deinococcus sp.]
MGTISDLKLVSTEDKKELVTRLARIEGQLRGIQDMVQREESCELVAQQLAAAREALSKAFSELVARTIERNCLSGKLADPAAREKLASIAKMLAKYA